jgi:hypothetical protein
VKRSRKGECFILIPRGDREWDVHTCYHLDGTLHMKSYRNKVLTSNQRQPLSGAFRGSEHRGANVGYGPKSVGAICDPTAFSGVVEVAPYAWGPMDGWVAVDLVEPGTEPTMKIPYSRIITRKEISDFPPWIVITVGMPADSTRFCLSRHYRVWSTVHHHEWITNDTRRLLGSERDHGEGSEGGRSDHEWGTDGVVAN